MSETAIAPETAPENSKRAPQQDFGALLRVARLAAGMDVETLAARLRLHPKQIEALERADLAALPSVIYVRGFLRGCARELKIDPQPLLADLDRRAGVDTSTPPAPSSGASWRFRIGDGTKPIIAILLFVLVLAGLVGTLIPHRPAAPLVRPAAPAAPVPAPEPAPPAPAEKTTASGSAAPAPAPEAATGFSSNPPAPSSEPQDLHAPALAVTAPNAAASPAAQANPAATAGPAIKNTSAAHASAETARGANVSELVLRIRDEAWVEVVQGDGTTLLSQVCAPGTIQTIKGKEPLHVVIGNPSGVDALFRGVPVDLMGHSSPNGVARLTLE